MFFVTGIWGTIFSDKLIWVCVKIGYHMNTYEYVVCVYV